MPTLADSLIRPAHVMHLAPKTGFATQRFDPRVQVGVDQEARMFFVGLMEALQGAAGVSNSRVDDPHITGGDILLLGVV